MGDKNIWLGSAASVAQVDTLTPGGTIEAGDVFSISLTSESGGTQTINVTATGTSVASVVADIVTAWNTTSLDLFGNVTAANGTTAVTLTAGTAGVPFYCSAATTESGGGAADDQTFTHGTVTASSGAADYNCDANWSLGHKPAAGEDVYFDDDEAADVLYGLNQSAVALGSFTVDYNYSGLIGGATRGGEYLKISATTVALGRSGLQKSGNGSKRIKLDLGSTASTVTIYDTSTSPEESDLPTVRLKAASASTVIHVRKGYLGLACESPAETSTVSAIHQAFVSNQSSDTQVLVGDGVTMTTFTKSGGKALLRCGATSVTNSGGDLTTEGSGAITTMTIEGGNVYPNSSGTITNLRTNGGVTDFTRSTQARTVSNWTSADNASASCVYDPGVVTMTLGFAPAGIVRVTVAPPA